MTHSEDNPDNPDNSQKACLVPAQYLAGYHSMTYKKCLWLCHLYYSDYVIRQNEIKKECSLGNQKV